MGEPIEFTKTVTEATYFIAPVRSKQDLETTKTPFKAYAESLGIDLTFQDFATEMANMPGKYAPPEGALFLAHNSEDEVVGCVGLRPLPSAGKGFCEMKRLYVDPKGRGMGIGKALAETAIDEAKRLRYEHVVLDTLANMTSARKLYKLLGFVPVEAYYENPIEERLACPRSATPCGAVLDLIEAKTIANTTIPDITSTSRTTSVKMIITKGAHKPNTASKQPTETFSGTVHMDPVFNADDNSCMGNNVCFTPGARTFWHTHEHGQILSVTMGTGLICSKGQPPRRLQVGDVVHIPAGETHWHGGSSSTMMAHLAISLGKTSWHDEVDQKEYEEANTTAT